MYTWVEILAVIYWLCDLGRLVNISSSVMKGY